MEKDEEIVARFELIVEYTQDNVPGHDEIVELVEKAEEYANRIVKAEFSTLRPIVRDYTHR